MRALARLAGPTLLLAGIGLVVLAVVRSEAALHLVIVVPVVTGSSPAFVLGVLLLVAGFGLLPLALAPPAEAAAGPTAVAGGSPESPEGFGGVVLVGPVPLFFGAWRHPGRRRYLLAVAVGAALLVVAAALWVFL